MTLDYPHNTKTLDRITHISAGELRSVAVTVPAVME